MAYIDYMDLPVRCPRKTIKLIHSLNLSSNRDSHYKVNSMNIKIICLGIGILSIKFILLIRVQIDAIPITKIRTVF